MALDQSDKYIVRKKSFFLKIFMCAYIFKNVSEFVVVVNNSFYIVQRSNY
jgi:hypothetical protein